MTKFNKSLLTAAVVGALALPSMASAASLAYDGNKQITFAKDLIVNNDTTIYTPRDLTLTAQPADATNVATVAVGSEVRVKVTLTNGAKFDTTADAPTLVSGFILGTQLGGTGIALVPADIIGTPYYSTSGQELNFVLKASAVGNAALPTNALVLNSMQVTNLVGGLFDGAAIGAEITVQNATGQQILAASQTIARSAWGLTYASAAQDATYGNYKIDVVGGGSGAAAFNRKTRFSPTGLVGGAGAAGAANTLWSAGGVVIDVTKAGQTSGAATSYINNYSAVASLTPYFNVVATSAISVKVIGSNLSAFANVAGSSPSTNNFLSVSPTCASADFTAAPSAAGDSITYSIPGNNALVTASVGKASPAPLTLYSCFRAYGNREMVAQQLRGEVSVDYKLPTQRVNPPAGTFTLKPLVQNGTEVVFQNVNPAGNATAQSFLRLTNNNAFACPVVIDAKDDAGKHSGDVKLALDAHGSKQLNSEVLEGNATSAGVTGKFGDGTGKWYVRVLAECDNFVASALNRHQDGVVTDLTPQEGKTWLTPDAKL